MAGTFTISEIPAFITARTLRYNAWQLRNFLDGAPAGPGVAGYEDFRVKQRGAGADLSVDVGNTALMRAWVRGSSRGGLGLWSCDNIDYTAPAADTYLAQINSGLIFTTGDATNPRIDQVFLRVLDQAHDGGGSNLLQVQVVDGVATAGATLDNRTGFGAVPANSILLADVLMPAAASTVTTANIRDRRHYCLPGTVPTRGSTGTQVDQVAFMPAPGLIPGGTGGLVQASHDNLQGAALMYLPRRIVLATRMRWKSREGVTPNANNVNIAICDASGRLIVATGSVQLNGAGANTATARSVAITATTFEAGYYYVWIGVAAMTAGSSEYYAGVVLTNANGFGAGFQPNLGFRQSSGGVTFPAAGTILGMTDCSTFTADTAIPPVPIVSLSVG